MARDAIIRMAVFSLSALLVLTLLVLVLRCTPQQSSQLSVACASAPSPELCRGLLQGIGEACEQGRLVPDRWWRLADGMCTECSDPAACRGVLGAVRRQCGGAL